MGGGIENILIKKLIYQAKMRCVLTSMILNKDYTWQGEYICKYICMAWRLLPVFEDDEIFRMQNSGNNY